MRPPVRRIVIAALLLAATACGRPFKIKTPPGLLELDEKESDYAYRAVAPDGVVVAVRVVDTDDRGDLDLWSRAATLRMRQMNGYALLATTDVKSADGTPGKRLVFGHDEAGGKPFVYEVRLFVAQSRLFVLEAGGSKEQMDRYARSVEFMAGSLRVQCGAFGYPVFASHTCGKW
jgi:hypothetical protein